MQVGDIVVCVMKGEFNNLTIGKQYVCEGFRLASDNSGTGSIRITDDNGSTLSFYSERFKLLSEYRDEKIDMICGKETL